MTIIFKNLPFILYSLLLIVMGLRTSLAIPYEISIIFEKYKFIIFLLFLFILGVGWAFKTKKINSQFIFIAYMFPIYYLAINLFFKNNINYYTIALYFAWMSYVFMLCQHFISDDEKLKKYLVSTIVAASIVLLWGGYSTLAGLVSSDSQFLGRYSLGYENPNYYAQYWQILFISIFFLNLNKKYNNLYKYLSVIIIIISIYFVVLARSRNVLVWMTVFIFWYYSYGVPGKFFIKSSLVVILVILISALSFDEANSLSSGRISLWVYKINEMLNQTPLSIFFGAQDVIDTSNMIGSYSRLNEDSSFTKLHADNSYLELYMEGGIIGMILFFTPYYFIYKSLRFTDYKTRKLYISIYFAYLAQSFFITTITSFFSPIAMFMGMIIIYPFIKYTKKRQSFLN